MESQLYKITVRANNIEAVIEGNEDFISRLSQLLITKSVKPSSGNIGNNNLNNKEFPEHGNVDIAHEQLFYITGNGNSSVIPLTSEELSRYNHILKGEREWVLIYCYHASSNGEKPFPRKFIREFYRLSGRGNTSRICHIYDRLKELMVLNYLTIGQSNKHLSLTPEGLAYIKEIMDRKTFPMSGRRKRPLTITGKKQSDRTSQSKDNSSVY